MSFKDFAQVTTYLNNVGSGIFQLEAKKKKNISHNMSFWYLLHWRFRHISHQRSTMAQMILRRRNDEGQLTH